MKRIGMVAVFALAVSAVSTAQTSLGIILGEPSGLTGKQWFGDSAAAEMVVAWSFVSPGALYLHLDYKQHFYQEHIDPGMIFVYAGIGPRIYIRGDGVTIGARIPVGIEYRFEGAPLEVFLEVAPGLNIFPETEPSFGGGIGVRFRF